MTAATKSYPPPPTQFASTAAQRRGAPAAPGLRTGIAPPPIHWSQAGPAATAQRKAGGVTPVPPPPVHWSQAGSVAAAQRKANGATPVPPPPVYWSRAGSAAAAQPKANGATPAPLQSRASPLGAPHAGMVPPSQPRSAVAQCVVKAYRVEYPTYKTQVSDQGKVTGFKGNPDGKGINISFVKPDHSEYFASERSESQRFMMRVVEFEINDDMWAAIQWKATGKDKGSVKPSWVSKVENLKSPSWSDGKSLTTDTKKTALGFNDAWLDVLATGVVGTAAVYYPGDDLSVVKDGEDVWVWSDADEQPVADGMTYAKGEAEKVGFQMMTLEKAQRLGHYTP